MLEAREQRVHPGRDEKILTSWNGLMLAAFAEAAMHTGRLLAERDITLVYGGGSVGLMGILADACLEAGGRVVNNPAKAIAAEAIRT